jgi:PAS domain S-box-containing protein
MSFAHNYISFHDLDLGANFLWLSPSVQDVLGYAPEELIGRPTYDFIFPEDIPLTKVTHKENLKNDLVASQIVLRYIGKGGRIVPCVAVFGLCYDFIFNCSTLVDPNALACKLVQNMSSQQVGKTGQIWMGYSEADHARLIFHP